MPVHLLIGTDKGGFVLRGDPSRASWTIEGPLFKGWKVTASARDDDGRYMVATASDVYGAALHVSDDLVEWRQIEAGPSWPKPAEGEPERKLNQIWTIVPRGGGRWLAGVDEAGVFASDDGGETWTGLAGLNEHPTRSGWVPGAGGLCAHAILVDDATNRLWCGISAVGVFRSDDGGATWAVKNEGVRAVIEDEKHKEIGRCVHGLVADPDDANVIYRREHIGMFRSRDGGDTWERIEKGLGSWFGFPISMDRSTRTLYCVPLESDEYRLPTDGKLEVFRSRDGGDSWESASAGLPAGHVYAGVLRGAMDVDHLEPCGVYFGTTGGTVHVSNDGGDRWTQVPCLLPRIFCVTAFGDD